MGNGASTADGVAAGSAGAQPGETAKVAPKAQSTNSSVSGSSNKNDVSRLDSTKLLDDVTSSSSDEENDGGEELALELFELLPYCGMGDQHTDNLVYTSLQGGNVDYLTVDDNGNTLLMIACQYRLEKACKLMIEQDNVDVNTRNSSGATPLHFACADGTHSVEVADLLLRHGANVNAVETSTGCTALHYAALVPDVEFVELLLRAGADPVAQDLEDYLPVDYANDVLLSEHVALLTSAGTAKRSGDAAYDAFLDNLRGGKSAGHASGGGGEDEIDDLLSELDMNLDTFSARPANVTRSGSNQAKATESELQGLLASVFTKEGVGTAVSSKKSLERSATVRVCGQAMRVWSVRYSHVSLQRQFNAGEGNANIPNPSV